MIYKFSTIALSGLYLIVEACNNNNAKTIPDDSVTIDSSVEFVSDKAKEKIDSTFLEFLKNPVLIHNTIDESIVHNSLISSKNNVEEYVSGGTVYLEEKHFYGDNVPFICYVTKDIKSLYIDGKKRSFIPEEEFFFRQRIKLELGYNRVPIKIINKMGYVTETYLEINMELVK